MPKKLETVKLITSLEKALKKTQSNAWEAIAEIIEKPRRRRVEINLDRLNKIAAKNQGKILVVPGKVLSQGEITEKTTIVSETVSEEARKKISAKAQYISLKEFAEKAEKTKPSEVIIVK
jgi:large subunit ribosomal protein L18e